MSSPDQSTDFESFFPTAGTKKRKRDGGTVQNGNGSSSDKRPSKKKKSNTDNELENNGSLFNSEECTSAFEVRVTREPCEFLEKFDDDGVPILHKQPLRQPKETEIEAFKTAGIFIKSGVFTAAENAQIKQNFDEYVQEYGSTYDEIFRDRKGLKERSRQLAMRKFFIRLCHGLNDRHVWYVYLRARKVCHPGHKDRSNRTKFTFDETKQLLAMKIQDGENYATIAKALNRTEHSVYEKMRRLKDPISVTKWDTESEVDLLQLLLAVSDAHGLDDFNAARRLLWRQIDWKKVTKLMDDRPYITCQNMWRRIVRPDCLNPSRGQFYFLCVLIYKYGKDNEEVPWDELATDVGLIDGYVARMMFNNRKTQLIGKDYPNIDVASLSVKKAAKKLIKIMKKSRIRCFENFESEKSQDIQDIPDIDSRHNSSLDY